MMSEDECVYHHIRLPRETADGLRILADRNGNTLHAEIINALGYWVNATTPAKAETP